MPALKTQADWRKTKIGAVADAVGCAPFAELYDGGRRQESRALLDALDEFHLRSKPRKKRLRSVAQDSARLLDPNENAQIALADLARRIDINKPKNKLWYQILWNTTAKLNPASKIKHMPKTVVDFCMDRIADGS